MPYDISIYLNCQFILSYNISEQVTENQLVGILYYAR